jgi:hypothetical protein
MSRNLSLLVLVFLVVAPSASAAETATGNFKSSFPVTIDGTTSSTVDLSTLYMFGDRTSAIAPKGALSSRLVNVTLVSVDASTVSAQGTDFVAVPAGEDSTRVEYFDFESAVLQFEALNWAFNYKTVPGIQVLFFPTPSAPAAPSFGFAGTGNQDLTLIRSFKVMDPLRNPDASAATPRPNDWDYSLQGPILSHTGRGDASVSGDTTTFVFGATFSVRSGQQVSTFATGTFTEEGAVQKVTRTWAFVRLDAASGTMSTEGLTASLMSAEIRTAVEGSATLTSAKGTLESENLVYRADSAQPVKIEGVFRMRSNAADDDVGNIAVSGVFEHISLASTARTNGPVAGPVPDTMIVIGVAAVGLLGTAAYMGARRGSFAGVGLWTFSLRKKQRSHAASPSPDDLLNSQDFVFANEVRALAYELVEKRAGLTKKEIVAVIGRAEAGAELDGLVAKGLILHRAATGRIRYFFPMRQVEENFERIAFLRSERASRVAEVVLLYGIIPAEQVEAAGHAAKPKMSAGEVRKMLSRMESLGLVRLLDEGANRMVEPTLALQECLELMGTAIPEARIRDYSS